MDLWVSDNSVYKPVKLTHYISSISDVVMDMVHLYMYILNIAIIFMHQDTRMKCNCKFNVL